MIQNQISETAHSVVDLSTSAVSVLKGEEDDEEQEAATSELKQDAAWAQIEKQVIALEERATSAELKLTDALSALEEARAGRAEAARIEQAQELRLKQAESMVQELSRSNDLLRSLVGDGSRHPSVMPLAFKHCIQSALIFGTFVKISPHSNSFQKHKKFAKAQNKPSCRPTKKKMILRMQLVL